MGPLDWRAICNFDTRRLQVRPDTRRRAATATTARAPAGQLELRAEDTHALLQAALAATVCGDLDTSAPTAACGPRSSRHASTGARSSAARLLVVAQAALQWGRWHMELHEAAWSRACSGMQEVQEDIDTRASTAARLEHAVAEVSVPRYVRECARAVGGAGAERRWPVGGMITAVACLPQMMLMVASALRVSMLCSRRHQLVHVRAVRQHEPAQVAFAPDEWVCAALVSGMGPRLCDVA